MAFLWNAAASMVGTTAGAIEGLVTGMEDFAYVLLAATEEHSLIPAQYSIHAQKLCGDQAKFLEKAKSLPEPENFRLSDGEEVHARAILQAVPSMMTLRYELVPRELSENQFWHTYFTLMREEFGEVDVAADIVREETGARPVDYSSLLDIDKYRATRTATLRNEERTLSGFWSSISLVDRDPALKFLIRKGVPDVYRSKVWSAVLALQTVRQSPERLAPLQPLLDQLSQTEPYLGDPPPGYCLNEQGQAAWRRIIAVVAAERDPDYRVKDLAAVLLHYFEEEDAAVLLLTMIPQAKYLFHSTGPKLEWLFLLTFRSLLHLKAPAVYAHIVSLVIDITSFAEPWFRSFFPDLSLAARLRLYDNYFQSGSKVLFRLALWLVQQNETSLLAAKSEVQFCRVLSETLAALEVGKVNEACCYRLQHEEVAALLTHNQHILSVTRSLIEYEPRLTGESKIATREHFNEIWTWLPSTDKIKDAQLLFTTSDSGYSLQSLFQAGQKSDRLLLLIRSKGNRSFGAFISDPLFPNTEAGSGLMFVFTLEPTEVYMWEAGRPQRFLSTIGLHSERLSIGAGALELDNELKGHSSTSPVFNNPPLAEAEEFEAQTLELWMLTG